MPKFHVESLLQSVVKVAEDKKATDVVIYQPFDTSLTDYIMLVGIQNPIHGKALLREIDDCISTFIANSGEPSFYPHPKYSGNPESGWVILDANLIMVHIISDSVREAYELDKFFSSRAAIVHL